MRQVANIMQVIFWTSVPLFAVGMAISWALNADPLAWPGRPLWIVVLASSGCLTLAMQAGADVSEEEVSGEARASETLVYPITFILAVLLPAFQLF